VLDLRSNPGGYLSSAVEVTGQFLRDGVVLYQHGEADGERKEIRTSGSAQVPDLPLAVLVDRGSASAAEVVAAALRDNHRAILVGEKTFGKGTVQELHDLSDNSQLRITVAQWLTPGGVPIQGEGLVPDIVVQSPDDRDAALDAAIQYLTTQGATARG
jgi:carboxyl-terminal processing protease